MFQVKSMIKHRKRKSMTTKKLSSKEFFIDDIHDTDEKDEIQVSLIHYYKNLDF